MRLRRLSLFKDSTVTIYNIYNYNNFIMDTIYYFAWPVKLLQPEPMPMEPSEPSFSIVRLYTPLMKEEQCVLHMYYK